MHRCSDNIFMTSDYTCYYQTSKEFSTMKEHRSSSSFDHTLWVIRLPLLLLFPFLFTLTGCNKIDGCKARTTHHFIEKYFIPTYIETSLTEGEEDSFCGITLCYTSCIDDKNSEEFRKIATEYGEMGDTTLYIFSPPFEKPYNIQGIKVFQLQAGKWVDVSDKVEIGYADYSPYILGRYDWSLLHRNYVRKKITELTEHDLKWLPRDMTLYFRQIRTLGVAIMEISIKDRPTIRRGLY